MQISHHELAKSENIRSFQVQKGFRDDSNIKSESKVTKFISTILSILQEPNNSEIVDWSSTGDMVVVKHVKAFESEILSKYFGHTSFASFNRQLNLYSFERCASQINQYVFKHPCFKKTSSLRMLSSIVRKKRVRTKESEKGVVSRSTKLVNTLTDPPLEKEESIANYQIDLNSRRVESDVSDVSVSLLPIRRPIQDPEFLENTIMRHIYINDLKSFRERLEKENAEEDGGLFSSLQLEYFGNEELK